MATKLQKLMSDALEGNVMLEDVCIANWMLSMVKHNAYDRREADALLMTVVDDVEGTATIVSNTCEECCVLDTDSEVAVCVVLAELLSKHTFNEAYDMLERVKEEKDEQGK